MKFRKENRTYVIAEIGINHNGSIEAAKKLIELAAESGADAVKFQVRDLAEVYSSKILDDPLKGEQGTQYLISELKKAHLTYDDILVLRKFAEKFDVDFFATPFDIRSAHFLNDVGMELFKVGSPDFTNLPLLKVLCDFKKPVILSTGMSTEEEIGQVIAFLRNERADFSLLHCNSTYPASLEEINLRFIPVLEQRSDVMVGYSGHEQGYSATIAAVSLGARIVERHLTLDRNQAGPDHRASLEPHDFKNMVSAIREIELALGQPKRLRSQGEKNNLLSLGKSLVMASDLKAGTILGYEHICSKTPAKGVSPLELQSFLGKKLNCDMKKDDYLFHEHVADTTGDKAESFELPRRWGIVGRLNDFRDFIELKPDLIEIHMTWRDLTTFRPSQEQFSQDLVVHAPEYYQDKLIDFTSTDPDVVSYSKEMLEKTIDIARQLNSNFKGQKDSRGPRVVVHPGGHFRTRGDSNKNEQYRLLKKNLKEVDSDGVRILVENMPPYPWYFGGQWFNTIFMNPKEVAQFAHEMGWGICYDTSHALLYCNSIGMSLNEFTRQVLPHVSYLHISDAKGATEEGLQLGYGDMTVDALIEIFAKLDVDFIPEIWQGHLNRGRGFKDALKYIEKLLAKVSSESCSAHAHYDRGCPDCHSQAAARI